jgi:hypothetical protein
MRNLVGMCCVSLRRQCTVRLQECGGLTTEARGYHIRTHGLSRSQSWVRSATELGAIKDKTHEAGVSVAEDKAGKEETRKAAKPAAKRVDGEATVLAKIAAMPTPYSAMGERLHALILRSAPVLQPTTWYGMPAYAKDGTVVCFFRADTYMTFGLTDKANLTLDEGAPHQLRESAWFFTALDDATEAKLAAIVRKAAS